MGLFLLVVVVVGDFVIAPEFESSMFYVIPVSFFAWFISRRTALITSVLGAVITLAVHRRAFSYQTHSNIIYWNALTWLGLYLFLVLMIAELRSLYERERHSSRTDGLTEIPNRSAFWELLATEQSRARRHGLPLTLGYLDLDGFKNVNDRFGHTTGDKLLALVAQTMRDNVRQADSVARIGGDEFAVLLPETAADSAAAVLHKLHTLLDTNMRQRNWPVTLSKGAVSF